MPAPLPEETPPRAWGRLGKTAAQMAVARNTPTGVGKTRRRKPRPAWHRKHPHGRGEDPITSPSVFKEPETPPRAWGRLRSSARAQGVGGNTPTGVGKTALPPRSCAGHSKHPHGRGEDGDTQHYSQPLWETPPRAWGRRRSRTTGQPIKRNTPTGVGKTRHAWLGAALLQKHPHGRGEDTALRTMRANGLETPPRAWGRLGLRRPHGPGCRNTPTGVGKTASAGKRARRVEKHPHGRGEDSCVPIPMTK